MLLRRFKKGVSTSDNNFGEICPDVELVKSFTQVRFPRKTPKSKHFGQKLRMDDVFQVHTYSSGFVKT